jgi:tRNA(Ile)-lysidine synthase
MSAGSQRPRLAHARRALERTRGPLLLAISGGRDSMTLLHLVSGLRRVRRCCVVATYDHATGPHAARAARLVRTTARRYGMRCVAQRAATPASGEAAWRDQRWTFLHHVARKYGAAIVTAHTRDDQIETVVMRVLRGTGARGLAALYADSPIVRPLLGTSRTALQRYAVQHGVTFVDDPGNATRRFFRNRVRLDLLPALRRVRPTFERDMLRLAREAARLRRRVDAVARGMSDVRNSGELLVRAAAVRDLTADGRALVWPAIVARLGVPLDRRGVRRAADFSLSGKRGQRVQCSGGVELEHLRDSIAVRIRPAANGPDWQIRTVSRRAYLMFVAQTGSAWGAELDASSWEIRTWQPGDRILVTGQRSPRRIKRYFTEHGISVLERRSWPVVVADRRVLWVPGICHAAMARDGGKRSPTYMVCERRSG